jgi:hypothetical protein
MRNEAEHTLAKQLADDAEQASLIDYLHVGRHLGMVDPDVFQPRVQRQIEATVKARGFVNVWRVARMLETDRG